MQTSQNTRDTGKTFFNKINQIMLCYYVYTFVVLFNDCNYSTLSYSDQYIIKLNVSLFLSSQKKLINTSMEQHKTELKVKKNPSSCFYFVTCYLKILVSVQNVMHQQYSF